MVTRATSSAAKGTDGAALSKAAAIDSFLKQQKQRAVAQIGKHQWLLTWQRLQQERQAATQELAAHLDVLSSLGCSEVSSSATELGSLSDLQSTELQADLHQEVSELRVELRTLVQQRVRSAGDASAHTQQLQEGLAQLRQYLGEALADSRLAADELAREAAHAFRASDAATSMPASRGGTDDMHQLSKQYPHASPHVINALQDSFCQLQHSHQQQLDSWQAMTAVAAQQDASPASKQWSPDEHAHFVSMRHICAEETSRSGQHSLHSLMAAMMPQWTLQQIIQQDERYMACWTLARKRRELHASWQRERSALVDSAHALLRRDHALQASRSRSAAERVRHAAAAEKLHSELERLRRDRLARQAAECAAAAKAEQEAQQATAAREAARLADLDQRKALAALSREAAMKQQRQAQQLAEAVAAEVARQAGELSKFNRVRVLFRCERLRACEAAREAALAVAQEQEQRRQQRLDALRAQVQPQVAADPARLLADTAASAARPSKTEPAFLPINGFTTQDVLKDQRFKVMEALRHQGMHASDYACHVIAAAKPACTVRVDTLTTLQSNRPLACCQP